MKIGTLTLGKKSKDRTTQPMTDAHTEMTDLIAANVDTITEGKPPATAEPTPPPPAAPSPPPIAAPEHPTRKVHVVKMSTSYFDYYEKGKRNTQLRNNDRNYQRNDLMVNREFSDLLQVCTGREFMCRIDDISSPPGLLDGHIMLHTKVV